ncbi:hypothetical protein V5799_026514 [Amblyomma americanum]|uniref:Uncharacterized protein n=1 Tax=Amblyomma americanum TaxID=6943 RepID=A0AAQ4DIC8_AMBAM
MPGRPKGEGRRRNSESEPITGETDVPRTSPPEQTVRTEEPPAPTPPPPAVPPSDQGSHEATDFDKPPAPKGRDVGTLPVVSVGGKLDTFLHDAEKSAATTFLLSFPAKMRRELVPFLSSSAAMELIRSYASRGIRGYGFARAEVPAEQLHNLSADYTTVLKSGTLEMLRDGRNVSATLAMSLTLGVLDYGVSPSGLAGIDGTWNVACTHSQLEPFEQVRTLRF